MESYKTFAQFYDLLTDNVDYNAGSEYISGFFSRYGNKGDKLLDLACGTGTYSKLFADRGYQVTGIDLSEDMLVIADNKCDGRVNFVCGDITDFSLPESYDYCVSTLDSLNHITDYEKLKDCIRCVYHSLNKGGLFVFDVNTPYKHNEILSDNTFVFDYEDFFLSWDNIDCDNNVVRILLDIFVFNGKNYDRFSEEFYEKAYSVEELRAALADFEIIGVYDELTENPPADKSERLYFVCRRN